MTIQEIIKKALLDKEYRKVLANSFNIDSNFQCEDCALEEHLFLKFLRKCRWNRMLNRIFENIYFIIITKDNVTEKVFKELVKAARRKNGEWLWVGLTHADLKEKQHEYLHSLPFLNESMFY